MTHIIALNGALTSTVAECVVTGMDRFCLKLQRQGRKGRESEPGAAASSAQSSFLQMCHV